MAPTTTCNCSVRCASREQISNHTRSTAEHYGFVLGCNPHDRAPLCMLSMPRVPTVTLHWNGIPTWDSLRDLRVAALTPAERSLAHLAQCGERVSIDNDAAALQALNAAARAALAALPTTLKDDLAQLALLEGGCSLLVCQGGVKETSAQECAALALRWRVGYKRMLYWASMLCLQQQ